MAIKGKPLRLLCVGKLKIPFFRAAAEHYAERLGKYRQLVISEVRDGDPSLAPDRRREVESQRLLENLTSQDLPIVLDERGKNPSSHDLASLLRKLDEEAGGRPCLVVGGAFGLSESLRQKARFVISLSVMTLPHELARVVLLEQLYRAETILRNIPYHH